MPVSKKDVVTKSPKPRTRPGPRVYITVSVFYDMATRMDNLTAKLGTTRHNVTRKAIEIGFPLLEAEATKAGKE